MADTSFIGLMPKLAGNQNSEGTISNPENHTHTHADTHTHKHAHVPAYKLTRIQ